MARSISWNDTYGIQLSGSAADDKWSFANIVEYLEANPFSPAEYDWPRSGDGGLGGSPYELCENNSGDWSGLNGLDTPTDDAVDYTKNSYSIKSEVDSVPSAVTFTRMRYTGNYIRLYYSNTAAYSQGDHIYVSGASFGNGIYQIYSVTTNSYISVEPTSDWDDYDNDYDVTENFSVLLPLTLAWNYDESNTDFPAWMADRLKFSAKSDGAGSPKIIGAAIRNYYGSGSGYSKLYYGVQGAKDISLTSSWQDFEMPIREDFTETSRPLTNTRTYWHNVKQIYLFFDGVSVGEFVWLDGVRLSTNDRNPEQIAKGVYKFNSGIICDREYFKDYGFNVVFNTLQNGISYGLYFVGSTIGDIEFGDYSGESAYEGGILQFMGYGGAEIMGSLYLYKMQMQGVRFQSRKRVFLDNSFYGSYLHCRDCVMENSEFYNNYFIVDNLFMYGGRYGLVGRPASLNNVKLYKKSLYYIFPTYSSAVPIELRNIKIVDERTSRDIIYTRNLGLSDDSYTIRTVDLDLSEVGDDCRAYFHDQYNSDYGNHVYIAMSVFVKLSGTSGYLENASIKFYDKNDNLMKSGTTDADGEYENTIDLLHGYFGDGASHYCYFDTPDSEWTDHYAPITMVIEVDGYQTYTAEILPDGYDRQNSTCINGYSTNVTMLEEITAGPSFYIDQEQI